MTTRILITGAGGAVGTAIASHFRSPGFSLEPAFSGPYEIHARTHAELDVTRKPDVDRHVDEIRPQMVIHAAGMPDLDLCEFYKWKAYLINRDSAEHVARAAQRVDALTVSFSTDLIYDGSRGEPYREEDPPNPLSIYGSAKLAGELAVMNQSRRHLILRTGWLFGPDGRNFVLRVLEWVRAQKTLYAYEDHERQPTYIVDFVRALVHLLSRGAQGVWNVASLGSASEFDVAREIVRDLGLTDVDVKPVQPGSGGRAAMRPPYSVLDCHKLEGSGFALRRWEEALREFLETRPKTH